MQTQSTTRDDKDQAIANQHNTIVIKKITNGEERASASDASKYFCKLQLRIRSRDVTCSGYSEELLPSQNAECEGIDCPTIPSFCNHDNQEPAPFSEGFIFKRKDMDIICPDEMVCSYMVAQFHSGGSGTTSTVYANQETETYVYWHSRSHLEFIIFMSVKRMAFDEFIAEQKELLLQPKKSVSTIQIVDQCGRANNNTSMCKINQTSQDCLIISDIPNQALPCSSNRYQWNFNRRPTAVNTKVK